VACWGADFFGQATPPAGVFRQVAAGQNLTCGVHTDGTVACWGQNEFGQAAPPAGVFSQVAAGQYHTCGVQADGTVACWGASGAATPPAALPFAL
jgi:alpha-tubulin suppressor-like RCC1 family protein